MGINYYGSINGPNFVTPYYVITEVIAADALPVSQTALTASQVAATSSHVAASSSKVVLQAVVVDGGFSGLSGSTKASVTSTISGVLAPY